MVCLGAAGCLGLAWWQWTRYESASGTFQNLGYALQWPMFAAFCFYAYYKFVRLEDDPNPQPKSDKLTEIPAGLLPERPQQSTSSDADPALREYNTYLSELAKNDAPKDDRTSR